MRKLALMLVLCLAFGSLGVQHAAAQATPKLARSPPATVPSPGLVATAKGTNKPGITKLIRIYSGAGYFDEALAQQLRPMLAKVFPSSMPEPAEAVPLATVVAPAKSESLKEVAQAAHL